MNTSPGGFPGQEEARAGASRQRILGLLRAEPTGLGVLELAERIGLHPNTVRFHLERLVGDGLAERRTREREERGRPPLVFTATQQDPARERRNYQFLAEVLAGYVAGATADPTAVATEAGRTWGRYLVRRPAPFERVSEEQAVGELLGLLDEIGFAPAQAPDDSREILLSHCPFREVAEAHRDVVCAVHLGLMQGALAELRAPVTADRLLPFVEPSLCVAGLSEPGEPSGPAGPA